jgi:hypothetical protein
LSNPEIAAFDFADTMQLMSNLNSGQGLNLSQLGAAFWIAHCTRREMIYGTEKGDKFPQVAVIVASTIEFMRRHGTESPEIDLSMRCSG